MQPIGIGIRILTMQKSSEKEEEDEENIKHERGDKHCWQSPGSGAGRFKLQGVMLMAEDVFPPPASPSSAATPQYAWRRTDWKRIKVANQCAL